MCQLLGMNSNTPTEITFSFSGFRQRGGATDDHRDGFGIAFFEPDAQSGQISLRLLHDDRPSFCSPMADFIHAFPIKATNTICHIRKASEGSHVLVNNHPFVRELWGESWVFAHNGQMAKNFIEQLPPSQNFYQPIGTTDSEEVFCYLLNRLRQKFATKPNQSQLFDFLAAVVTDIGTTGIVNLLLSNGEWQFVYANTLLFYVQRQAPFMTATLIDTDQTINFADTNQTSDQISVIASTPLTRDENWQQLAVGESLVFKHGEIVFQQLPKCPVYLTIAQALDLAEKACDTL